MAERRMFTKKITNSDAFIDMPLSTQALYFHLNMEADDDGFNSSPKKIQRMIGASDDDLKLLMAKNFIIPFESGVVVIKHWKLHNYIQNDRYKETVYTEEKKQLKVKENKVYSLMDTNCIQDGYTGKVSIDKYSIDKNIYIEADKKQKYGEYGRVKLTINEYQKLCKEFGEDFINSQIQKIDEYVESNNNKNKYSNYNLVIRKSIRENWFRNKTIEEEPEWFNKKTTSKKASEEEIKEMEEMLKSFT